MLNGAFEKHTLKPSYKKSRGLALLDFFHYENVKDYISNYDFKGIEPFTMLIINSYNTTEIVELRWDGNLLHHKKINPKHPHIWSSVTLYSKEIIVQREKWFKEWLNKNSIYTPDEIPFFHHFAGNGDKKIILS